MRFFRFKKLVSLNTGKYLKYAVGEVILVVIGILIALQVNNWNEYRKEKVVEKKILLSLHNEISNNLESLEVVIDGKNKIINVNEYIINNTGKNGEWKSIKPLDSLMNYISLSGWIFVPQNGVLNEIINSGKLLLIENDLIKNEIASLPQLLYLMIEEDRQYRLDLHQYFLPFLSKNYNLIEITKYRELLENYSFKMGETNFSKSNPELLGSREFENILTIQSIWIKFSNEMSINQKNKYLEIQNLIEKEYPEVDYINLRQNLERGIFG
ncbi:MAG: hypothetical protein CMC22_01180 [Flavobacteriaceae bacterium]|nr:hypothetical protein [Flavobacteriaceae bacterium]|tara:strand:+ start:218 stop:1024 length:807 start_codon:yes stop_codon:yes gene_type:complete